MSTTTFNFENIRMITTMFVDIFIMWWVFYFAIRLVLPNQRTRQIFKGILLVLLVDGFAKFFGLKTLEYVMEIFLNWGILAIIIIFQPEIRSLLERMGKTNYFSRINTLTGNEKENLVNQIATAVVLLSRDQTGALISIEQSYSLEGYVETGTKLNSAVSAELLTSIFVTSTPLHDGAVIIQGDRIVCASAYFPPTNLELPSRYGARHRAAIGISEITDAVTIVVSEETGGISIAEGGKLMPVSEKELRDHLLRVICGEETEVRSGQKPPKEAAREVVIEDRKVSNGDTGVLKKLAIKKQENEQNNAKLVAEEVVPAEVTKEEQPVEIVDDEPKKHHFSLFGHRKETADKDAMKEIEKDAADIKLPKKKERPVPSYPEQNRDITEKAAVPAAEEIEQKIAEPEPVFEPVPEPQPPVYPEPQVQPEPEPEDTSSMRRMSAEEVRKAREESMRRLANIGKEPKPEPEPVQEPVFEPEPEPQAPVYPEPEPIFEQTDEVREPEVFDTTKIDITSIVDLNNDLEQTLSMVDSLKPEKKSRSSYKKGGEA